MRSVSQAYKDAFLANTPDVKREVSYKRRYWNAATKTYAWESSWTVLTEDRVISVTPVTEQLDLDSLNEFKVSNITLNLKNDDNRWRSDNPVGVFGPDSASPLYFYADHWTKFRVRIGVRLQDSSYEYTARFVGLAVEYTAASQDEIQVTVQGLESLLQNANAENVSTRVVEENVGTGNGVTTAFTTTHPGVGIIEEVSVAGITKVAGTDYSVSNLNSVTLGATVTFTVAPASGTVRVTYKYWKQAQKVESLVADLLTEAGIAGVDQLIDPVFFPGGVTQVATFTSQADWIAGTLTDVEATSTPGDVRLDFSSNTNRELLDDFSDNDYSASPAWTYSGITEGSGGAPSNQFDASSGALQYKGSGGTPESNGNHLYTPSTRAVGVWQFDFKNHHGTLHEVHFAFIVGSLAAAGSNTKSGYGLVVTLNGGFNGMSLYKFDSAGGATLLAGASAAGSDDVTYTFKIVRAASGEMKVYRDGVLFLTVTDTQFNASSYVDIKVHYQGGVGDYVQIDNIYQPKSALVASAATATYDIGSTPTAFGRLTYDQTLTGAATSIFYTRSSADGSSWDAWTAISDNGQINSTPRRYVQVRWSISVPSDAANDALLSSMSFTYVTSSVTIALANFTGKTVYDQVQELGAFASYEWGFTPDEDFFFRAKDVAKVADAVVSREINLSEINGLVSGQDRVFSEVRATYGAFTSTVKVAGDTEGDARAKYGSRILEVDGGDVLLANDANIAAGVSASVAAEVRRPRRRMKATCKLLPYLDLADVVLISFDQNVPLPTWHHGDTTAELGDQTLQHYGPHQQLVSEMYAKVVGARHDPDNFKTEIDLQEVL